MPKAPVVLFLGAGASVPIGFPTTRQIMENMGLEPYDADKLKRVTQQGDILRNIYSKLPVKDLEGILDFLRMYNYRSDIGDFRPFKYGIDILKEELMDIVGMLDDDIPQPIKDKTSIAIKDEIIKICDNHYEEISRLERQVIYQLYRYYHFGPEHRDISEKTYKPILDLILNDQVYGEIDELPIFTTNYDLVFENLRHRPFMTKYEFINGFSIEKNSELNIFDDAQYERKADKQAIKFFKLHGSLSWANRKEDNMIVDFPHFSRIINDNYTWPLIIPPAGFDKYPRDEFHILHEYFEKYLEKAEICIVIGYSFRDIGRVGHIFEDVMNYKNKDLHVIISGKRPTIDKLRETMEIFKKFDGRYTYYPDGIEKLPSKLKNKKTKKIEKKDDKPKTPT